MGLLLNKILFNRCKENKSLLKAMQEADNEVWEQKRYLDANKGRLTCEEIQVIENRIERAEERYLLLELKRA